MPGQVEGKLGLVARIGAEGGVAAVERTVEKLAAVFDHKVPMVGGVAEGAGDVVHQIGLRFGDGGQRILPKRTANEERGQQ